MSRSRILQTFLFLVKCINVKIINILPKRSRGGSRITNGLKINFQFGWTLISNRFIVMSIILTSVGSLSWFLNSALARTWHDPLCMLEKRGFKLYLSSHRLALNSYIGFETVR